MPDDNFVADATELLNDDAADATVDDVDDDLNGNLSLVSPTAGEDEDEEQAADEADESDQDGEEAPEKEAEGTDKVGDQIPHYQEIKAKYPNFFKEFPGVKAAYFFGRDAQAVFGSIENIKGAAQALDDYQEISRDIFSGKSEGLLNSLKGSGKLDNFAQEFLPTLFKLDQDSFIKVTEPVVANVLRQALQEGTNRKDQNLVNAAKLLSREIFGKTDIPEFKRKTSEPDPEKEQLRGEIKQRDQQRELSFTEDVNNSGERLLKAEIQKLIPTGTSEYQKKVILREAYEEVNQLMVKDASYLSQVKSLWQGARRSGFVGDWKNQILRAALVRAKQSISSVAKKHVLEITGKAPVGSTGTRQRGEPQSGNARQPNNGQLKNFRAKDIDTRQTSALDILNDKVVLKKSR